MPQPVADFTSTRVLTMDFIAGTKITSVSPVEWTEVDGAALADDLFRAYLTDNLLLGVSASYNDTRINDPNLTVSQNNTGLQLTIAISYGARAELARAVGRNLPSNAQAAAASIDTQDILAPAGAATDHSPHLHHGGHH